MSAEKRPASDDPGSSQLVKRQNVGSSTARSGGYGESSALIQAAPRLSSLQAPLMELSGHSGEIFCAKFNSAGQYIASGSMDRSILLWRANGDCENYGILSGHRGAILDLQWSRDSDIIFSASADMHLASWDLTTGERIRRYVGHEEVINSLDISKRGEEILFSGSDDGTIGIWDPRKKHAADYIESDFPVTAVAISEAGNEIYSGGIDNDIKVWDVRKKAVVYNMAGHRDTITTLKVSPDSQSLLSYAMDSTARTWDIRPFAPTERHIRTFDGAPMGIEKNLVRGGWDKEGKRVAMGAADGTVVIWSNETGKLTYKLPGHKAAVNCVEFSPGTEPLILSGSSDKTLLVGELR
ncbi:hypothetical protein MCOR27_009824 [Pyricularia oryzae]|uniref:Uncharacterized protein n=5 Tax=Pyricularia TaxID=48558 RepID=A0ABQ8P0R8_PYRGI|nr:WD repeat-containing protein 57 [Pyricularia oryzae 70-15]ELQ39410.1 WD repeat-containing protein 57 [Pyricularia oryzae Y34]KAH8844968.1 hypothetical protein MCOR01_002226 [Pyricularia oryzae]KAI6304919.1 hypothetical protein MCOR33_000042 [Pyricularia grisea]EHA58226.1 WD repeat-containing protein 57 [Pyricularia oryzae 70-15]KAH9429191.1 hypothetical protein MCOR02_010599 [Pyricularia oryzae]